MVESDESSAASRAEQTASSSAAAAASPQPVDDWFSETPAHSTASYEAFLRDLPELMKTHPGLCAAYQNGVRMGIGPRRREFYQELYKQGCDSTQLLLFTIEPQEPMEVVVPGWSETLIIDLGGHADDH